MSISLRKANLSDIEFLWYLRNQPDVYKYFRQARKVSWQEHIKWILPIILEEEPRDIYLIRQGLLPVGQIRFDHEEEKSLISIAILKQFRGKGIAVESFKKAVKMLPRGKKTKVLMAEIHRDNISSKKLFESLNFKPKTKKGKWLKYALIL